MAIPLNRTNNLTRLIHSKKMKTFIRHLRNLILLCVIATSCSEESQTIKKDPDASSSQYILEAKHAHDEIVAGLSSRPSNAGRSTASFRGKLAKSAQWNRARVVSLSVGPAVFVPLKFDEPLYARSKPGLQIGISATTYLLVYKGKDSEMHSEVVTTIPDQNYLKHRSNKFTGTSIVEDWNGNFIKGYLYSQEGISAISTDRQSTGGKVQCVTVDWYTCAYGGGSMSCSYDYTEETCVDDGGGSDGGYYGGGTGGTDYGGGSGDSSVDYGGDGSGDAPPPSDLNNPVYTCPDNFRFSIAVSDDLWQEAALTNIYCKMYRYDNDLEKWTYRLVQLPKVYFGLPYNNIEGGLVYNSMTAAEISADVFNQAEWEVREYFKTHPNTSASQLASMWLNEMKNEMATLSLGRGRVDIYGSTNHVVPVVPKPYVACD
jgi:hypothetical protein